MGLAKMIRKHVVTVTASGSAGSASGSAKTNGGISGRVLAVHFDFSASPASTIDTVLATGNTPTNTILTLSNVTADGWYYPRAQMQGNTGTALTGIYEPVPVADSLSVSLAQANNGDSVTATIYTEE